MLIVLARLTLTPPWKPTVMPELPPAWRERVAVLVPKAVSDARMRVPSALEDVMGPLYPLLLPDRTNVPLPWRLSAAEPVRLPVSVMNLSLTLRVLAAATSIGWVYVCDAVSEESVSFPPWRRFSTPAAPRLKSFTAMISPACTVSVP